MKTVLRKKENVVTQVRVGLKDYWRERGMMYFS